MWPAGILGFWEATYDASQPTMLICNEYESVYLKRTREGREKQPKIVKLHAKIVQIAVTIEALSYLNIIPKS